MAMEQGAWLKDVGDWTVHRDVAPALQEARDRRVPLLVDFWAPG
jgi:hypothetical protein